MLAVKAVAGASRDRIVGVLGDCLKIATSAAPEKGKANARLAATLAKALAIPAKDVTLIAGQTNPRKEFVVRGIAAANLRERLAAI